MVSFLLIISFLLHLIILAAIYQLLKKVRQVEEETNAIDVVVALEQSLEEIREENNRFEQLLQEKANQKQGKETNEWNNNRTDIEGPGGEDKTKREEDTSNQEEFEHLLGTSPGYEIEASLESRVLQLHEKGHSIADIARNLGCGKTEAELIIKMYKKL